MLQPVNSAPAPRPLQRALDRLMVLAALANVGMEHQSRKPLGTVHWAGIAALIEDIEADIIEADTELGGSVEASGGMR